MGAMARPHVFQRDEHVYIVAPLSVTNPGQHEIEQFAFAEALKSEAPNDNIMWLHGHYVEADRANANGQEWTSGELSLTHLTPRLMPVTIMHDPATAVGLIADASLATPDKDNVPRSRIDTTLAVWKHRFPEIAAECDHNYREGTLMQSMECLPGYFECGECGQHVPNSGTIDPADFMCEHLSGANGTTPVRRLRNVVFTGTGLIFGTRGSRGAYDQAHLDVFQDEVAEFHAESKSRKTRKPTERKPPRSKRTMEIENSEYAELQQRPTKDQLAEEQTKREQAEEAAREAEQKAEQSEIAKKAAEDERDELKAEKERLEEEANQGKLSKDRMSKLGKGFLAKLTDSIKEKLEEQSKTMKDEEWSSRVEELSELTGVDATEESAEEENEGEEEFSAEEVASTGAGRQPSGSGKAPSRQQQAGVFGELFRAGSGRKSE